MWLDPGNVLGAGEALALQLPSSAMDLYVLGGSKTQTFGSWVISPRFLLRGSSKDGAGAFSPPDLTFLKSVTDGTGDGSTF